MATTQDAIDWALASYNAGKIPKGTPVEVGTILWETRRTGAFRPDSPLTRGQADSVDLYPAKARVRVLQHLDPSGQLNFVGDYHAHTRFTPNWIGLFPSPEDFSKYSPVCDFWPTTNGAVVPIAPRVQLIQILHFGDVYVVEPAPNRQAFASPTAQAAYLATLEQSYAAWHLATHGRLGQLPAAPLSQAAFQQIVSAELPAVANILVGRATIRRVANPTPPSDQVARA